MPSSVIAAIAALEISALAVAQFIGKLVLSFALQAIFAKKPERNAQAANLADQSQTLTSLEPAASWEVVYGQVRKGGKLVFRHVTDTIGSAAAPDYDAVIPHSAPFEIVLPDAAEFVSNDSVLLVTWDREGSESAITSLSPTGGAPSQGEYSVIAGVYTFNAADAGKSVRIRYVKRNVDSAHNRLHMVIVLAAHECEEIGDIYFNDEVVPLDANDEATGRYAGHVLVKKHLGIVGQQADGALMAEAPEKWTANHRLTGHTYIYVRLLRNRELFPNGVPNISAIVKGRKVYDSRDGVTRWTANAALCIADYLNHPTWGLNAAHASEIDDTLLDAAANVCDENVSLAAGGTEDRYTCNGIVDTAHQPQEILQRMLTSLAGRLVYIGGKWRLRAGAYITPSVTLDEGDARGPIRVRTKRSRREVFNAVKGVYVSPDNAWQPSDFPAVTSATYLAQDNGEQVWENIDLPFTTSAASAQRIAKIVLERIRRQVGVTYPANLSAYRVEPPETLMLDNTKFGYSSKVFEVMELGLVVEQDENEQPVLGVNLALQETDSSVYTWSSAEEQEVDAAPTTTLPDPRDVAPPGVPSITETLYEASGSSGVRSKAIVTWGAAPDGQAYRYELEYKEKPAVQWIAHAGLINGTHVEISDLTSGRVYQFRVRAVNALQARSIWSQAEKEIIGLTAAPTNVTGFAVQSYAEQAKFVWDKATDLDVFIGGRMVIRWTPITSGATWNIGALVRPDGYPGDAVIGFGPLQTGTYMAKFQDSTGNLSPAAAAFVVTEALLRTLSSLDFIDFHPTFASTKTNTVVTDLALQLTAMTLWDAMSGDIDTWGMVDYLGGIASSGSALFDEKLDLGSVMSARLFTHIESEGYEIGDVWDARTSLMDSWGRIENDEIEDAEVEIMVRITDDDPAGTPAWGEWHPLGLVADYRARGFEFRADFTSADPTHNRRVTELTITAKE